MNYSNTNEKLYEDIALWEKTDGRDLFAQMPLAPRYARKRWAKSLRRAESKTSPLPK